jgi:hypothetical protein
LARRPDPSLDALPIPLGWRVRAGRGGGVDGANHRRDAARELRDLGRTIPEIAALLDVSNARVDTYLAP